MHPRSNPSRTLQYMNTHKRNKLERPCYISQLTCYILYIFEVVFDLVLSVFVRSTPVISGEHQIFGGVMENVHVYPD